GKLARRHPPFPMSITQNHFGITCKAQRRPFRRGIGMGETPPDRATVSNLHMRDRAYGMTQQWPVFVYARIQFKETVTYHRTDNHRTIRCNCGVLKRFNIVQINQGTRVGESEIQCRHQTLPTRQEFGRALVLLHQGQCFFYRAGCMVNKRWWFHNAPSSMSEPLSKSTLMGALTV